MNIDSIVIVSAILGLIAGASAASLFYTRRKPLTYLEVWSRAFWTAYDRGNGPIGAEKDANHTIEAFKRFEERCAGE